MLRFNNCIPILILNFCLAADLQVFGQDEVTVRLTVFQIDRNGETAASGKYVMVFPKNQGVSSGYTNGNGEIAFRFPKTESVIFRIGEMSNQARMQPLSGRLSQNTSYILDRRPNVRTTSNCYAMGSALADVLYDFQFMAGGRLMNDQSREYFQSLRPRIIEATTPGPDADDYQRENLAEERQRLLNLYDEMLRPPYKMGASYETEAQGARIVDVAAGGPANIAGLQAGDIVTQVGFLPVSASGQSLQWLIANAEERATTLKILRNGVPQTLQVNLTR